MRNALAQWRFLLTYGLVVVGAVPLLTSAERPSIPRIGVLNPQSAAQFEEYLRLGLREVGYTEGQNIIIEWRRGATRQEEDRKSTRLNSSH